jgi:hypothetical protein
MTKQRRALPTLVDIVLSGIVFVGGNKGHLLPRHFLISYLTFFIPYLLSNVGRCPTLVDVVLSGIVFVGGNKGHLLPRHFLLV